MIHSAVDDYAARVTDDTSVSGVSWGAILAGAFGAAALSFILIILGFGLGLSSVSPWSGDGLSAQTIGYSTIVWVAFTQIAAAAVGGYLAGRLRVKWASVHSDEVYFRDTAHGFLAWAVASLATAALLTSAIGSALSGGAKVVGGAGAAVATAGVAGAASAGGTAANGPGSDSLSSYFVDALLRPSAGPAANNGVAAPVAPAAAGDANAAPPPAPPATPPELRDNGVTPAQRAEIARIFANALRTGALPDADKAYVAQLLARRTGMSQGDAEKRVGDTYASYKKAVDDAAVKAREAADKARKAAAYGSLWMFVALLCGAFIASLSATYGGRQRDRVVFVTREPELTAPAVPPTVL